MKIYQNFEKAKALLGGDIEARSWSLTPIVAEDEIGPKEVIPGIIKDTSIEYESDEMTLKELLRILYEELTVKELEKFFAENPKIETYFLAHISANRRI